MPDDKVSQKCKNHMFMNNTLSLIHANALIIIMFKDLHVMVVLTKLTDLLTCEVRRYWPLVLHDSIEM